MPFQLKAQLKMSQQLSMTTQLQQSIQLLSLNHQEIKEIVEKELLENPVLQTNEEIADSSPKEGATDSLPALQDRDFAQRTSRRPPIKSGSQEDYIFENFISEPTTFKQHLMWQTQISSFSEYKKSLIAFLIFNLDDRGYLPTSLEELSQKEKIPFKKLEEALFALQDMDPVGVGARHIQECLILQACQQKENVKELILIIKNHLNDLKNKEYKKISSCLNLSEEELTYCCSVIQSMEPIPARNFSHQPVEYLTPDVYIYKQDGEYKILLNEEGIPQLRLSAHYQKMLHNARHQNAEMKKYIKEKLQGGSWFIRSLLQRQETIRKVIQSVVKHQKEFLDKGFLHLKPLILQDVAEDISVHISTVSRVTSNKYVQTPQGLIPLKFFFNAGILNRRGQSISIVLIKYHIKSWINQENPQKPLSDRNILERLRREFDIDLSRRTVAQYRDSLGISSALKRKIAL